MRDEVQPLLDRFLGEAREVLPRLEALWAHGSLALGDYQPDRSDLDLVALVADDITPAQRRRLGLLHKKLIADFPRATKLHCSYVVRSTLADTGARHLTWAHQHLLERPVTSVSRRELRTGDLSLFGPPPTELVPAVTDEELARFIRDDLRTFWLPATARPARWLQDIWVDLGMVTAARAHVTLTDGRLVTKGEALDILTELGAPPGVVADIRLRRYGTPGPLPLRPRVSRAHLARTFTRRTIRRTLAP